jgi:uncharacterized protein
MPKEVVKMMESLDSQGITSEVQGMKVDLRNLDGASGTLTSEEDVPFKDAFGEPASVRSSVELSYNQAGGAFYFHGEVRSEFVTKCHRCLLPHTEPLENSFDVEVRRSGVEGGSSGVARGDHADHVTVALNEHQVSFSEYINENTVVSIPMLILCTDDCKGLCPTCGVNLNQSECSCETEVDSRWGALKKLSENKDNQ